MTPESTPLQVVRPPQGRAPRVSVIVPAFKARGTLLAAVQSMLQQTWRDLEVIVVDDACPQDSTCVLEGLEDPRLRVIRLSANAGVSSARNAGIGMARGDLIALLDADDRSLPDRLQRQVALLDSRPDVGLVAGLSNIIDQSGCLIRRARDSWQVSESALKPLLLFANPFTTSSLLIRRSAIPEHGFRPILAEDYALTTEVAERHPIALLREAVVDYRRSEGGYMATKLDLVAKGALSAQRRLLSHVGLKECAVDADLLRSVFFRGTTASTTMTLDWLGRVRRFIDEVRIANSQTRIYQAEGLSEASTRIWEMVLWEAAARGGLRLGVHSAKLFVADFPAYATSLRVRAVAHSLANLLRTPRLSG